MTFDKRLTALERAMIPPPLLRVDKIGEEERWYYGSKLVKWIKGVSFEDI